MFEFAWFAMALVMRKTQSARHLNPRSTRPTVTLNAIFDEGVAPASNHAEQASSCIRLFDHLDDDSSDAAVGRRQQLFKRATGG